MRKIAVTALVVSLGLTASLVPAFAGGENAGDTCYADGAAASCVQPARVTLGTDADTGTVAGPSVPTNNANPYFGGDKD